MVGLDQIISEIEKTYTESISLAEARNLGEVIKKRVASTMTLGYYLAEREGIWKNSLEKLYEVYDEIIDTYEDFSFKNKGWKETAAATLALGVVVGEKSIDEMKDYIQRVKEDDRNYITKDSFKISSYATSLALGSKEKIRCLPNSLKRIYNLISKLNSNFRNCMYKERAEIEPFQADTKLNQNISDIEWPILSIGAPALGLDEKSAGTIVNNHIELKNKLSEKFGNYKHVLANLSLAAYAKGYNNL